MSTTKTTSMIVDRIVAAVKSTAPEKAEHNIRLLLKDVVSEGVEQNTFYEIAALLKEKGYEVKDNFETLSEEVASENGEVEAILSEEKAGLISARNGFIAGTVIGAGAGVLHRGMNTTTLATAAASSVGSYFLGNQLEKHIPESVQNKYAKVAGGVVLGLGFGAGSVVVADVAKNVIADRFFNDTDTSAADAVALF